MNEVNVGVALILLGLVGGNALLHSCTSSIGNYYPDTTP